jgi:hypothetical protein
MTKSFWRYRFKEARSHCAVTIATLNSKVLRQKIFSTRIKTDTEKGVAQLLHEADHRVGHSPMIYEVSIILFILFSKSGVAMAVCLKSKFYRRKTNQG